MHLLLDYTMEWLRAESICGVGCYKREMGSCVYAGGETGRSDVVEPQVSEMAGSMAEVVLFTVIYRDRSYKIRGDVAVLRRC